ncbi:MAG: hypothetical protein UU77_C0005G0026, partial [candidate division WWE3 bacterium GW2011_GWC1_41_7]
MPKPVVETDQTKKEQQKRLSSRETRDVLEDISTKTKRGLRLKDLNEKVAVLL